MHAITIPHDMIHNYMYAQELVRAKGLKEWQTLSFYILTVYNYNSADIQACYLAIKANIYSSWIASETHNEMSSLLVIAKSHLFPQFVHLH